MHLRIIAVTEILCRHLCFSSGRICQSFSGKLSLDRYLSLISNYHRAHILEHSKFGPMTTPTRGTASAGPPGPSRGVRVTALEPKLSSWCIHIHVYYTQEGGLARKRHSNQLSDELGWFKILVKKSRRQKYSITRGEDQTFCKWELEPAFVLARNFILLSQILVMRFQKQSVEAESTIRTYFISWWCLFVCLFVYCSIMQYSTKKCESQTIG